MKLKIASAVLAASSGVLMAQSDAIDSNVIHDYSQVGVGYGFLSEIGNSDVDGHGAVAGVSYEVKNFVLGVGGGYFWIDEDLDVDADLNLWSVNGSVGYVFRTMDDHLNIIPNISIVYSEFDVDVDDFGDGSIDATVLTPGISVSYAFNNKFSIHAGYNYAFEIDDSNVELDPEGGDEIDFDVDSDVELHIFNVGANYALTENVGLGVTAYFIEEQGFTGLTAGVSYHY